MVEVALEALGEDDVLARAEACADTIRDAEAELLEIAYQWAVLHSPAEPDRSTDPLPGRERSRVLGGPATPVVREFAAAALGARIGRSPYAAARLMGDALDLHHRLPQLWARVEAGDVRASYARHVCVKTRDLQPDEAAYVDAGVAESADGRIAWSRFEVLVEAKVAAAAPEAAREREERASRATFAKKCRGEANGMASFLIRADVATIDQIDAAVTAMAAKVPQLDETDETDMDLRRVRAVLVMANPGAAPDADVADLLPTVQLYLHGYAGVDGDPVARLEGHGPVTEAWIGRVLGPQARFKVTPVLDLAGQAPVDAYEIPDRHRQAVHLMTPADVFPYAASVSRHQQIDHTIPFDSGGASAVGNYGPMTTRHHRIKTHADWDVRQPFPGVYVWRDPGGVFYLVDHTGTRRLPRRTTVPLTVELYRGPVRLVLAA